MLLKKTLLIAVVVGLVGCSKGSDNKEVEQTAKVVEVDWSVLGEDQQHTVEDFEVDSSARVYVLGECAKLVTKGTKTPVQCESAATAEYNVLIKEVELNSKEGGVEDLSPKEKEDLKHQILVANTYG